ncbi:MAG TPA: hypothetical protein VML96_08030 [Egibacteraceae bacterium]|nr:hypothetical protein [Egibacteraceae bacterium]
MSSGSRKKRATRPWQNTQALRGLDDLLVTGGLDDELELDGYEVRRIDAGRALKDYVCPECGNTVPAGESHVVVWPDEESDLRRHWHKHCWRLEVRRTAGAGE